jgi:hypothetical protein
MRLPLTVFAALLLMSSCVSAPHPSSGSAPKFNVTEAYDVNGFLLNPAWTDNETASLAVSPHPVCEDPPLTSSCNDQHLPGSGVDAAAMAHRSLFHRAAARDGCDFAAMQGLLPGHINLGVATFEGSLSWTRLAFNGDDQMRLHPLEGGLTQASPDCINLELNVDETLGRFDCLTAWWKQYADMSRDQHTNDLLIRDTGGTPPFAIITGVLGFDCQHGCVTDLQPVYVMAIRRSGGAREQWSFFVRNWGSGGWCGVDNHALNTRRLRVFLPYPGAQNPNALMEIESKFELYCGRGDCGSNKKALAAVDAVGVEGGVLVTFDLPDAASRPVIEGELSFRWQTATPLVSFEAVSCPPRETIPNIEAAFDQLKRLLPPAQSASFFAVPARLTQPSASLSVMIRATINPQIKIAAPSSIAVSASFDSAKDLHDQHKHEQIRDLCGTLHKNADIKTRDDYQTVCASFHQQ